MSRLHAAMRLVLAIVAMMPVPAPLPRAPEPTARRGAGSYPAS
ncbi:MAG: hypothetical protein WAP03_25450 [Methylorubrum rhodinum]